VPRARELSVSPGVASKGARGMLKERTIIGVLGLALAGCQTVAESQTQGTVPANRRRTRWHGLGRGNASGANILGSNG